MPDRGQRQGPDQSVPEWDNAQAATIFEQMLTSNPSIGGVLAANDGLGNAAISVLKKQKLNGKVPVTGQDATVQGLQHILAGGRHGVPARAGDTTSTNSPFGCIPAGPRCRSGALCAPAGCPCSYSGIERTSR